ncbi:hypothetical protein NWQ33_03925 [Mycoplasmopsis cynos]|nr:hypothetical protein [Mycoplasmopsis cynos]
MFTWYEKSNDLSSYNDLFKQAKTIALNSYINTTLKIQTTKPFLNLGRWSYSKF